jgi:hypothetical protein
VTSRYQAISTDLIDVICHVRDLKRVSGLELKDQDLKPVIDNNFRQSQTGEATILSPAINRVSLVSSQRLENLGDSRLEKWAILPPSSPTLLPQAEEGSLGPYT